MNNSISHIEQDWGCTDFDFLRANPEPEAFDIPNYFRLAEFMIVPEMRKPDSRVPLHVVEKILAYHLPILNPIRYELGEAIYISKQSGYRPVKWELDRGRDGDSQHTFKGLGAVDLTCDLHRLGDLKELLIESDYERVCWYPNSNFLHCDFASDEKRFFEDSGDGWQYKPDVR